MVTDDYKEAGQFPAENAAEEEELPSSEELEDELKTEGTEEEPGEEALERMTEKKPDVISLDLVMPKMSGLKFYKYIQKNKDRSGIPVIVVTAHAKDEMGKTDIEKIKAAKPRDGMMFIVDKPINPPAYVNTVRRALGMSEIEPEETGEEDVLKIKLKEKIKSADKKKLEDALKILD